MLERRDGTSGRHYRAYLDTPSKVFPDGTVLAFGGGELRLMADEWLKASLVTEAFLAFLNGSALPDSIKWRDVTSTLRSDPA